MRGAEKYGGKVMLASAPAGGFFYLVLYLRTYKFYAILVSRREQKNGNPSDKGKEQIPSEKV
jgi:hypothetical protein